MENKDRLKQRLDCGEEEFDLPSFEPFSKGIYATLDPLRHDLALLYRQSKKLDIRLNALEALGWYSEKGKSYDVFLHALGTDDDRIKEKVAEVIASLKGDVTDEMIASMIPYLLSDAEATVNAGIRALSSLGPKPVPLLLETLRNKTFQKKRASLDVLVTLDWIIMQNRENKEMIESILEGVYRAFADTSDPSFFWKAGDTIGDHIGGEEAYKKLAQLLKDTRPEVRASACHGLGHTKFEKAVPALLRHLKDESPEVRIESTVALGGLRTKKAVNKLIQMLDDPDIRVKGSAAFALGLIGDKKAVKHLHKLLTTDVKKEAAIALAYLGDSRSLDILFKILNFDSSGHPRYHQVIKALGILGDKRAINPLLKILTNQKKHRPSIIKDTLNALERLNFSIYDS